MPIQKVGQLFQVTTARGTDHFFNLPSGIQQWDIVTMFLGVRMWGGAGSGTFWANSGIDWNRLINWEASNTPVYRTVVFQMTVPEIVPTVVHVWSDYNECCLSCSIVAHRNALPWDGTYVGTGHNNYYYYSPRDPWYCGGQPASETPYLPPSPPVPLTLSKAGYALAFWAPERVLGTPTVSSGLTLQHYGEASVDFPGEHLYQGGVLAERYFGGAGNTGQMWASYNAQNYMSVALPVYETNATPPQFDDRFTMDWKFGDQIAPAATIRNRNLLGAAYHAVREKHIIFGGNDEEWTSTTFGDTWEVDLAVRTCIENTGPSPGARYGHSMCYDSYRGRVMMWGHHTTDTGLWEFNTAWYGRNQAGSPPTGRPSARSGSRLCYDPVARRGLLFGGHIYSPTSDTNETWEVNFEAEPVTWTKITPATSPSARYCHAMVYNPTNGLIYMTGGSVGSNPITTKNDCWTYNMATHQWAQVTGDLGMQGRTDHGMFYDSAHQWVTVIGGYTQKGVYGGGTVASQICQILVGSNWYPLKLSTSVVGPNGVGGIAAYGMSYDADRQSSLISLGNWDNSYWGRDNIAEGYFIRPEIKYVGYYGRAIYDPNPTNFTYDLRSIPGRSGDWIYIWGWFQKNGYNIGTPYLNDSNYQLIFSWDGAPPPNNSRVRVWRGLWGQVSLTPTVIVPPGGDYVRAAIMGSVYRNASSNILASSSGWGGSGYIGIRMTEGFTLPNQKNVLVVGMITATSSWGENGYSSRVFSAPGWSRPGVVGMGYGGMSAAVVDKYITWSPTNTNTGPVLLWPDQGALDGLGYAIMLEAASYAPPSSQIVPATDGSPLLVIAQDVVLFRFSGELAVDSPYLSTSSYKIEGIGHSDDCWVASVLPVLGRTSTDLYIKLGGIMYGNTYKFTVLDQQVHDNYGGILNECSITWTHHRTKVDSVIAGLPGGLDLRERSNVRGLVEAMMISDEIIGGDF